MATVTLSLYEAIQKRKSYRDRLAQFNIKDKTFVACYCEANKRVGGVDLDTAANIIKGNFDSYIHLSSNVEALNAAINKANLENTVVIPGYKDGKEITLIEAITTYQGLDHTIALVKTIATQIQVVQHEIEVKNDKVLDPDYAYSQVQKVATNDKKSEKTMDVIKDAIEKYQKDNTWVLFDPNDLVKTSWVDKKIAELTALKDNFHAVTTKANTSIEIEVDLED